MDNNIKTVIKETSKKLSGLYKEQKIFDVDLGRKPPSRDVVITIIDDLRRITFPGFFGAENLGYMEKKNFAGHELSLVYDKLYHQIKTALNYGREQGEYEQVRLEAEEKTLKFIENIPKVQSLLLLDVEAGFNGDPAAKSKEEIILSYPGLYAIFVYRYAHVLYEMNIPFIPRMMSEYAHSQTGIDINPGATIGSSFFIDHGTGIVVGETTNIGNNVKIYQGVTLGALSTRKGQELAGIKRHPTIEDNVVIYANTTVLGGETVIGENSVVAGNTFVIKSIPANTKAASSMPELRIKQ